MDYGDGVARMLEGLTTRGVERMVLLIRHSAREYHRDRHDLENQLTPEGRALARSLGERLPEDLFVRGYASPPERCMETAALILDGYRATGGRIGRHRPVEGLGVFYALDQMRMWRAMMASGNADAEPGSPGGGMHPFLTEWFAGGIPADMLIPADQAARLVIGIVAEKYAQQREPRALDVCVSHDMTLYLVRNRMLGLDPEAYPVNYLDGVVYYEEAGQAWLESDTGQRAPALRVAEAKPEAGGSS